MKLKNCVVGQRVQVKEDTNPSTLNFIRSFRGQQATIIESPDRDGDVRVQLDSGRTDIGHHTNLRKIKE